MRLFSLLITSVSRQPLCYGLLRRPFGSASAAKLFSSPDHTKSNHRFPANRFCTASEPPIKHANQKGLLTDFFRKWHSDAEQEKILELILNCDRNETDWYPKLNDQLVKEVYQEQEYEFAGLNAEQIERLQEDYKILQSKRLVPPKIITDIILKDLIKVWDDEAHRRHFLAYQGIKQLKRFKFACKKQIKSMFKLNDFVEGKRLLFHFVLVCY